MICITKFFSDLFCTSSYIWHNLFPESNLLIIDYSYFFGHSLSLFFLKHVANLTCYLPFLEPFFWMPLKASKWKDESSCCLGGWKKWFCWSASQVLIFFCWCISFNLQLSRITELCWQPLQTFAKLQVRELSFFADFTIVSKSISWIR